MAASGKALKHAAKQKLSCLRLSTDEAEGLHKVAVLVTGVLTSTVPITSCHANTMVTSATVRLLSGIEAPRRYLQMALLFFRLRPAAVKA